MEGKEQNVERDDLQEQQEELIEKLNDMDYDWDKHPKVQGIIRDNQKEREMRHSVEQQILQLRSENQKLKQEFENTAKDQEDELGILEDVNDGDYLTVAQAKKLLQKGFSSKEKEVEKLKQDQHAHRIQEAEAAAKEKYTANKVGEGLDYTSVIENGYKKLLEDNPALHQGVMSSSNPAETAYKLGLTHPDVAQKADAIKKQQLLKKLNNVKTPRSGGSIMEMEDEDFTSLLSKDETSLLNELRSEEG